MNKEKLQTTMTESEMIQAKLQTDMTESEMAEAKRLIIETQSKRLPMLDFQPEKFRAIQRWALEEDLPMSKTLDICMEGLKDLYGDLIYDGPREYVIIPYAGTVISVFMPYFTPRDYIMLYSIPIDCAGYYPHMAWDLYASFVLKGKMFAERLDLEDRDFNAQERGPWNPQEGNSWIHAGDYHVWDYNSPDLFPEGMVCGAKRDTWVMEYGRGQLWWEFPKVIPQYFFYGNVRMLGNLARQMKNTLPRAFFRPLWNSLMGR